MPVPYTLHVQSFSQSLVDWVELARPSFIKMVACSEGIPTLARWISGGFLKGVILRSDDHDFPIDYSQDIPAQAQEAANRNLAFANPFQAAGLTQYLLLEGPNEPTAWNGQQILALAEHEAIRAEIIAAKGMRALTFQFPVGHPEPYFWKDIIPQLRRIKAVNGALALHQYNQPSLLFGPAEWLTYRHEWVYAQLPTDLQDLELHITEFGIDGGVVYPDAPQPRPKEGWRSYTDEDGYLTQLQQTLPFLTRARSVCLFTFGNPNDSWPSFEMEGTGKIARWIGEQNTQPPPQEDDMTLVNNEALLDLYVRSISGVGLNRATALGAAYLAAFEYWGPPTTDEIHDTLLGEPIVYRIHVNGVAVYRKSDGHVSFITPADLNAGKSPFG